jgi:hypothetical protein
LCKLSLLADCALLLTWTLLCSLLLAYQLHLEDEHEVRIVPRDEKPA